MSPQIFYLRVRLPHDHEPLNPLMFDHTRLLKVMKVLKADHVTAVKNHVSRDVLAGLIASVQDIS